MEPHQDLEVMINEAGSTSQEDVYRITVFRRLGHMNELLIHPQISQLIEDKAVRLVMLDNYRFKIFIRK